MSTIKEHDVVRLKVPRNAKLYGVLHEGDEGTVVHVYRDKKGREIGVYEVEFPELLGNTMTLLDSMIKPI